MRDWTETQGRLVTYLKQIGTPTYWTYHLLRFWRSLVRRQGNRVSVGGVIIDCQEAEIELRKV
jgi:hypothetical protein